MEGPRSLPKSQQLLPEMGFQKTLLVEALVGNLGEDKMAWVEWGGANRLCRERSVTVSGQCEPCYLGWEEHRL